MKDISIRLVEVHEVLNNLDEESYSKIPKDFLESIDQNEDKSYHWKYDSTKTLAEQNLPHDTICILSYINSKFLLNKEQKEYFDKLHRYNSETLEEQKRERFDPKTIFERNVDLTPINTDITDNTQEEKSLVIVDKGIISKVINFIKKLFF